MNERIADLYEKASEWALESDSPKSYKDRVMSKFAELIVRECCTMVNKHMQHNNPNDCLLVLDIKQHFGVEE